MSRRHALAAISPAVALAATFAAGAADAHGFGQRYDLPVPLTIWIGASAIAVALSFVVLAVVARRQVTEDEYPRVNLLEWRLGRVVADRHVRDGARLVSVAFLALVLAAALFGSQNPTRNLAPIWVWVIWWVGFAYVSALAGDLWAVLNPWAAMFRWAERAWPRADRGEPARAVRYPPALGMWPAAILFGAFAWAELVYSGRTIPAQLAVMIIVYSLITWTGMFLFGRAVWLRHGDPFAAAFGIFARFAPTEIRVTNRSFCHRCPTGCGRARACINCGECFDRAAAAEREWNLRPFGVGLTRTRDVTISTVAFVLLLLSTVTFDGFTATPVWAGLEGALYKALASFQQTRLTLIGTAGLVGFPLLFAGMYALFVTGMARAAGGEIAAGTVARLFVLSLVPIAIGYHLAHYFTYLLIQGQLVFRLASDPFGYGWNLFGTGRYRPNIDVVGARFAWYTAVVAIVVGHIVAVYIAHVVALREFSIRRAALRSQFPMLVLMVGYTIVSLWIIAQPIVETSPRG